MGGERCEGLNPAGAFFGIVVGCAGSTASRSRSCRRAGEQDNPLALIDWQEGPSIAVVGGLGEVEVPAGYQFTERKARAEDAPVLF